MGAFEEGAEAYRRGDDIDLNPYDEADTQFDEWEDGYGYHDEIMSIAGKTLANINL